MENNNNGNGHINHENGNALNGSLSNGFSKPSNGHVPKKYNYTKKAGRTSNYDPNFCKKVIEYFTVEPYKEVVTRRIVHKDGKVEEYFGLRANDLRFFESFAHDVCKVSLKTVLEWCKEHEDFRKAYLHAKSLQLQHLAINGLQQTFNSYFAIFTAKNISHWRDKVDIEHSVAEETLNKLEELSAEQLQQKAIELSRKHVIPSKN